jgi:hypothetical protein
MLGVLSGLAGVGGANEHVVESPLRDLRNSCSFLPLKNSPRCPASLQKLLRSLQVSLRTRRLAEHARPRNPAPAAGRTRPAAGRARPLGKGRDTLSERSTYRGPRRGGSGFWSRAIPARFPRARSSCASFPRVGPARRSRASFPRVFGAAQLPRVSRTLPVRFPRRSWSRAVPARCEFAPDTPCSRAVPAPLASARLSLGHT